MPARLEQADADLCRLRRADGVVDDVDATGVGHRQAAALEALEDAAGPGRRLLEQLLDGEGVDHGGAQPPRQRGLGRKAGDDHDLDVGVERPDDGGDGGAECAAAVDEDLAAGRRRMTGDRMQRHGEGVG